MRRIYLDYAATTPLDERVFSAMQPYLQEKFGNAGSLHWAGQEAQGALDIARKTLADAIGAHLQEIYFTGSATEANNLILRGVVASANRSGNIQPHIIVSTVEHESVLATARELEKEGVRVGYAAVGKDGVVRPEDIERLMEKHTVLVSCMLANNEIGTIQPVVRIGEALERERTRRKEALERIPLVFHTDAVQAFAHLPLDVAAFGIDAMTVSAHKLYGPKGVGALYVRKGTGVAPQVTGGGQEYGLRSGTENIACIVGFAEAVRLNETAKRTGEPGRISALRDALWKELQETFPDISINGGVEARLPNNLNVRLPGVHAEEALVALDAEGVAISIGSACSARARTPSHVLEAIGLDRKAMQESVRLTVGRFTSEEEVREALAVMKRTIAPLAASRRTHAIH